MSERTSLNKQDILDARAATSIDVARVRNLLYDGDALWAEHDKIVSIMSRDPTFDKSQRLYMTRSDRYKRGLRMTNRVLQLKEKHQWSPREYARATGLLDEPLSINLNDLAFAPVFMAQASPLLLTKFGELIANRGILGCYLQTELGHGSNVASLETTAIYIPKTREFEIHSSTLTSTKWWVGSLARTSTHGVVQAQLILPGGKNVGPHLFFVQLRSLKDHNVLPGIALGEIGPKVLNGYSAVDNGYARFNHVRIPREHMLSKFARVTESGEYVQPPHAKISYGGMLYIRSTMVSNAGWTIAKAATIAIRYATVRRQGNKDKKGLERQIISYPSVYYRLLPILSHAFVFIALGRNLTQAFSAMSARLATGDTSLLAEMHATTSGLKILVTTTSVQDVETARRAMGGHGYSAFSGLGRIYADNLPSVTYEGDNFVLDQQVVRAAVKAYKTFTSSAPPSITSLSPSAHYLRLLKDDSSETKRYPLSWENPHTSVILLELRAAYIVQNYVKNVDNPDASADQRVSKAVTEVFVAVQVEATISDLSQYLSQADSKVVGDLLTLYLLTTVEGGLVDLLSFGLLPTYGQEDPTYTLRSAIKRLCLKLLPQAIGLSDSFGFSDWELDSALGVHDGDVYQSLWEHAQTEPLNHTEIPDGYLEYIKPLLERGQRIAAKQNAKL